MKDRCKIRATPAGPRIAALGLVAVLGIGGVRAAPEASFAQPTLWAGSPDIAAFENSEAAHLAAAQASIGALTAVKGARSVDNTLGPFDAAVRQINTAAYLADVVQKVHPNPQFRDHATEAFRKASAAQTALSLNRRVFQALAHLDLGKADAATRYYVKRQLLEFRLAGVNQPAAVRRRLKALNDELTTDQSMFERNIADDQRKVELADAAELGGLPQDYIDAHKPGPDGKIRVTTDYPDVFPVLKFANSGALRRRLWRQFEDRGYPANREVLLDMMRTRYRIATLLGFASWADYNAADKMIGTGADIGRFIEQLHAAARPLAEREFAMLLAEARKTDPGAAVIEDPDRAHLNELLRRAQYDFDSQALRPYLAFDTVKRGLMATAAKLFGVEFREERDVPSWDPAVETWDVIDAGASIGRFYLDMHPRPGKYKHAEMAPVLDGIRGKQLPEAILICNFPAPTPQDAGLMEFGDAVTFFHEFGHLMHHIIGGHQRWAGISGITMEADFVEAPSQMLEHWMHDPGVLASFARHYETGAVIPVELVKRLNRADAFGRAGWAEFQLAYAAVSYDLYKSKPDAVDIDAVYFGDIRKYSLFVPDPNTHAYASFGHLAGYSSAYYTYMWDAVIADDFFAQFDARDPFAGGAPERYKRAVLEPGGSIPAADLVKNFLGRTQNTDAFRRWIGEEFEPPPGPP